MWESEKRHVWKEKAVQCFTVLFNEAWVQIVSPVFPLKPLLSTQHLFSLSLQVRCLSDKAREEWSRGSLWEHHPQLFHSWFQPEFPSPFVLKLLIPETSSIMTLQSWALHHSVRVSTILCFAISVAHSRIICFPPWRTHPGRALFGI